MLNMTQAEYFNIIQSAAFQNLEKKYKSTFTLKVFFYQKVCEEKKSLISIAFDRLIEFLIWILKHFCLKKKLCMIAWHTSCDINNSIDDVFLFHYFI